MIPPWLKVPTLAEWENKAKDLNFSDVRNVGLVDAVHSGWYQNASDELFRGFKINSTDIVVDVGCGPGGASLFCAQRGAHLVCCDIDKNNIDNLSSKMKESRAASFRGLVTDCTPLPLPDNFATRIISMEMLEHVDDPEKLLLELARIGKPGALYLISVPDATSEKMQKLFAPAEYWEKPNHIHIFETHQLENLVNQSGLRIIEHTSYGFFWNLWVCIYWVLSKSAGKHPDQISANCTQPPFFPILDELTSIWDRLISLPEFEPLRSALDSALPRSRIILAQKPF